MARLHDDAVFGSSRVQGASWQHRKSHCWHWSSRAWLRPPADAPPPVAAAASAPATEAVAVAAPAASSGPSASVDLGRRVESESFTAPPELARCIAHNIQRKMPQLSVRQRSDAMADERILLVLSMPGHETFGVIRLEAEESGSRLTTWLAARDLPAAPEAVAKRLVAGC